ncbi:MAG: HD domain-containing protein [Candidatus Woesebacteria bacterium]|nr:HD domain-containing protein [Candidatus Woesebacteria bacterium]
MIIQDKIYGNIKIKDKVIEELILSKPLQRLKKISQDGAPHFIQPIRNVNRFEHSIGVWYLSSLYKRPIEEQIACLLHDVPHTAFSHVIDFVMEDEKHEFHEKFTEKLISESEIPNILNRHGVDIKKVLDKDKFELLENNLPDISFDRWDYFMRDGFTLNFLSKTIINEFITNIHLKQKKLYFRDIRPASMFAILFTSFSRLIWLDPTSHGSFFLISEALKIAVDIKLITHDDFFTNDELLMKKLKKSKNIKINNLLDRLKKGKEFVYAPQRDAEFFGSNKPRSVDPLIMVKNKLVRLSTQVPSLGYYFEEFKENYKKIGVKQL